MEHSNLLSTRTIAGAVLVAVLTGGCAAAPPTSLQQMQSNMVSKLAAQCYWEHDGERYVFGAGPVWSACMRWARAAVDVRFTGLAGNHRDE